ncbi:MAG: metallophosphoesterase [Christensenellales bacterium]|jgi:predicted phosphodiesterase
MKYEIAVAFRRAMTGRAIMHISDTPSFGYGGIERLLRDMKPDLLIHTGDMADDFKAGRIPEHIPLYREATARLLAIMKRHSTELWIACGNNDDIPWLRAQDALHLLPATGSERSYCGLRLFLQHTPVPFLDRERYDFALYGHGFTDDRHDPNDNRPGALCYFNGVKLATLIDSATGEFCRLPYLKEE